MPPSPVTRSMADVETFFEVEDKLPVVKTKGQ